MGQRERPRRPVARRTLALWLGLAAVLGAGGAARAESPRPVLYVVPIDGVIDLGLAPFVERVLDEAASAGAAAVILEVNTFGGRVDAAVLIRDGLLAARVPTVAFVNRRAISAGALIGLAAEKIAMADGATIGAAAPIQAGPGGTQPASEKTVSYLRKEFRATAEARKRPPLLAEAMVDTDVDIPGFKPKGKLLTLTTAEALQHGVADFQDADLGALLARLDLANAEVRRPLITWAEDLVRFLTHPVVASLLLTIGVVGVLTEVQAPGLGVPGLVGLASLALFFWGHWLTRLAGWEEILLIVGGLVLLGIEVFLLPGFGVAGTLGFVAVLLGLGLSLVGPGATWTGVLWAVGRVVLSLVLALVAGLVLLKVLPARR